MRRRGNKREFCSVNFPGKYLQRTSMLYTQPSRNAFVQLFYQSVHVNKTRSMKHEFPKFFMLVSREGGKKGEKINQKNNNKWKLQNWTKYRWKYLPRSEARVSYFVKLGITNRTYTFCKWSRVMDACFVYNKNVNFRYVDRDHFGSKMKWSSFFFFFFFFFIYIRIIY